MSNVSAVSAKNDFQTSKGESATSVQQQTETITVPMVSDKAPLDEDLSQTKEPQFVEQYGNTKLPEGSVLKRECIRYANVIGEVYQVQVGVVELPNGVIVTLLTNPDDKKNGSISIEKDGTVTFNHVSYTDIKGTDNDDKFNFKNPVALSGYQDRNICTGKGNDIVINPTSVPDDEEMPHYADEYGRTEVNADENLSVQGNKLYVHIRAQGNLDLTKSWRFAPDFQGSVDLKK